MNLHVRHNQPATTQAAEGLPRRKWSIAEIERLGVAGFFDEGERFELIGGEIVPMAAKGVPHETVKKELTRFWVPRLGPDLDVLTETTLRVGPHDFREPDFVFWPRSISVGALTPADVLLIVEVADSSLAYDLGRKAEYYASLGLADYWVIDAPRLVTRIHRDPGADGFRSQINFAASDLMTPLLLPDLAVRLVDLALEPLKE